MYVSKNLFDSWATFINVPDPEFFHTAIDAAKERLKNGEMNDIETDVIKRQYTPVVYCSSIVSKKASEDNIIERTELTQRSTKKYLIIDADYDITEKDESERVRNKLIELSERLKCKLILYPTVSYPLKPRFRAVLFVQRTLSDVTYNQAMRWLFDQLGVEATDSSDMRITSNHNLPVFTDERQLDAIYDNTENDEYGLLDNSLWKLYPKMKSTRKKAKTFVSTRSRYDDVKLSRFKIVEGAKEFAGRADMLDYNYFWRIVHSVARAEIMGQITNELALTIMKIFASAADDEVVRSKWEYENEQEYMKTVHMLSNDENKLYKAQPLFSYNEWKKYVTFEENKDD